MVFLAVVIAVALTRFTAVRLDGLALSLIDAWGRLVSRPATLPAVVAYYLYLAVPLALLGLVLLFFDSRGWQAAGFLVSLVILLGCLHPGQLREQVRRFAGDLDRGDLQAAYHDAAALGEAESTATNWQELHAGSLAAIAGRYFQCYFPVIFWFSLFGALGALLYRLAWYGASVSGGEDGTPSPVPRRLLMLLEWLPLRLLGFTLALMGNFPATFSRWRASLLSAGAPTLDLLKDYVRCALYHPGVPDRAETEIAELDELDDLIDRSLLSWLAVLALLTLVV